MTDRLANLEAVVNSALEQMAADAKSTMIAMSAQKKALTAAVRQMEETLRAALDEQTHLIHLHHAHTEKAMLTLLGEVKVTISSGDALSAEVQDLKTRVLALETR